MHKTILLTFIILTSANGFSQTLSLEQCKELALKNNVAIRNNTVALKAAEQQKKEAFTRYFPSVEASANSYSSSKALMDLSLKGGNLPVYDGNPANLATATQVAYFPDINMSLLKKGTMLNITATQPVFAGGRIVNANKLASIGVEAQKLSSVIVSNDVMYQAEQYFYQILTLQEKMKTINQVDTLLRSLQRDVEVAQKAGLTDRNQVLTVRLKQNELEANKSKVKNGIEICKIALSQYIGIPYDSTMQIVAANDDFQTIHSPLDLYIDPQQAVSNRSEYKLLDKNVAATKLQTRIKQGELLPEAGVGATYVSENLMGSYRHYGIAFASLKVPVTNWWGGGYAVNKSKLEEQIAQNNQKNGSELLMVQMQQAWMEVTDSYKQTVLAQKAVEQAEENLRLNCNYFKAGTVALSDLLSAELSFQQSKDKLTDASFDYKLKKTKYLQLTGR